MKKNETIGNKKTYICHFPEYIPRKEFKSEEDLKKDKAYEELNKRRQEIREKELREITPSHNLVVHAAIPTSASGQYSSLCTQKLKSSEYKKLPAEFINTHPLKDDGAYNIKVYFNVNGERFYELDEPYILGYLRGFIKNKNGDIYAKIESLINRQTTNWILRTHYDLKLKVSYNGSLYIDAVRQWDKNVKHIKHPITGNFLTEFDAVQIIELDKAYKELEKRLAQYTDKLKSYNTSNSTDLKEIKFKNRSKARTYRIVENAQNDMIKLKEKINAFWDDHIFDDPDDEKWSVSWKYV